MSEQSFREVRPGYSSPAVLGFPIFGLMLEFGLIFDCYVNDLFNQTFLITTLSITGLTLCALIVALLYKRTVELTSNGYRERSQISRWILWEENYPLHEVVGFESIGDPDGECRMDLRLSNGERLAGLNYLGNTDVAELANRLNSLLRELRAQDHVILNTTNNGNIHACTVHTVD
ncbi:MAG: hypothetical protein U0930_03285 [Pirellulales bacterium]